MTTDYDYWQKINCMIRQEIGPTSWAWSHPAKRLTELSPMRFDDGIWQNLAGTEEEP